MHHTLETTLEELWKRSRFSSYFYQTVQFIESGALPTLGLTLYGPRLALFYNADFIGSLEGERLIGLLVHEMLHIVHNHDHRAKQGGDPYLQNLAQDMAINSYLSGRRENFFSRKGRYTNEAPLLLMPKGLPVIPADFFTESGKHDPSWEDVYIWLKAQPREKIREFIKSEDVLNTQSGNSADVPPERMSGFILDGIDLPHDPDDQISHARIGEMTGIIFEDGAGNVMPTGIHFIHNHDISANIDGKRRQIFEFCMQDATLADERAFQDLYGIIHRAGKEDIAAWKRQLKSIIDFTSQSLEWAYTYSRFNRRYSAAGIYAPGRIFKEQELFTVVVDVSASMVMNPSQIESAFGVIEEMLGRYRVHLLCIDEELFIPVRDGHAPEKRDAARPYVYRKGDWRSIKTGSSGTTFFAPLFNRHMKGHREMLVVVTDGYIYDLDSLMKYTPTLWVIPGGRDEPFNPPFGRVVTMQDD